MTRQTMLDEAAHLISQRPDCEGLPKTLAYLDCQVSALTTQAAEAVESLRLDDDGGVWMVVTEGGETVEEVYLASIEHMSQLRIDVARECPALGWRIDELEDAWRAMGEESDRQAADDMAGLEAEFRAAKGV